MAVDLARLSLWLVTLAKDYPLTFVDHALRRGDSLVGLSHRQIEAFHWKGDAPQFQAGFETVRVHEHLAEAAALRRRIREGGEEVADAQRRGWWRDAREALRAAGDLGDLVLAAFFEASKPKAREAVRTALADAVVRGETDGHRRRLAGLRNAEPPLAPFHWQIEFPEVFERDAPGFDAIVGNPPFAGKNSVAEANIARYPDWLKQAHPESHGNADLVAHFFRRAFDLLRPGGAFGLIATNTIAQGDTRSTGLRWICNRGGAIYRAQRRVRWPGLAAVVVSVLHVHKPESPRPLARGPAHRNRNQPAGSAAPPARAGTGRGRGAPGGGVALRPGAGVDGPELPDSSPRRRPAGRARESAPVWGAAPPAAPPAGPPAIPPPSIAAPPVGPQAIAHAAPVAGPPAIAAPPIGTPTARTPSPAPAPREASAAVRRPAGLPAPRLDGAPVERITAFLFHRGGHDDPARLQENAGKSFQGSIVLGMGFTFDDTDRKGVATPLAEMERLLAADPRNAEVIQPYIGGEEVNTSPTHAHHRHVINFRDWPLRREAVVSAGGVQPGAGAGRSSERVAGGTWEEADDDQRRAWLRRGVVPPDYPGPVAADWPNLVRIVEEKVKGTRGSHSTAPWWQFERLRPELYAAIADLDRVLVTPQTSNVQALTFVSSKMVFGHTLIVFRTTRFSTFATLQSRCHMIWSAFLGPTMKDDLRYTPSDCFETFPFPDGWDTHPALEAAGREYHEFRAALMVKNDEGLTKTCNRFHDPDERDPRIAELRTLHAAMDRAVLDAYGWTDIPTDCEFLLDHADDDTEAETAGRQRKKPYRYRWPDTVRDEVLARLLELNATRAAAETRAGTGGPSKQRPTWRATDG